MTSLARKKLRRRLWLQAALRRTAITLMVLAVLGLLAGAALRLIITPQMLKAQIAAQLAKSFKRPVSIDHVSIVLHQGLKISGLKVEESAEFPGDIFLSSEYLIAKYKLAALLRGRLELSQVLLMAPHINLVRREDGVWNLEDVLSASEEEQPQKRFSIPPLHAADLIEIERGRLSVRDPKRRINLKVNGFRLHVRNFSTKNIFPIQFGFTNENRIKGKHIEARVEFVGGVSLGGFKPEHGLLVAKKVTVLLDGNRLSFSGMMQGFTRSEIEAKIELPAFDSELLGKYYEVPEGIRIPKSSWEVKLALPYLVAEATDTGGAVVSTAGARGAANDVFRLRKLDVKAWPARVIASGEYSPARDRAQLNVRIPRVDLPPVAKFYAGWKEKELDGTAEGLLHFAGPLKELSLTSMSVLLRNFTFSHAAGKKISQ
ncbi:MAG: AsmA family protein, partial [Elusimicrobiota bacterium]